MSYTLMDQLRWWLPLVSGFGIVIKAYFSAKKSVTDFAERLLNNHLSGIEAATQSTELLTRHTNEILTNHTSKMENVQAVIADHNEKEMAIWQGVIESLILLKERTSSRRRTTSKRKPRGR